MIKKNVNRKACSLLLIIIMVCSGLFIFIPSNSEKYLVNASSTWTQTSNIDFNNGTFDNITIQGNGDAAKLRIKFSGPSGWIEKRPSNGPTNRFFQKMASIYNDDKVLLFGGIVGITRSNDTYIYDLNNNGWTQKLPATSPNSRSYFSLASNNIDDKAMLFGGFDPSHRYDDTWVYDLSNNTWDQKTPISKPSARTEHATASVQSKDEVVLFGGMTGPGIWVDDTWIYDFSANTWNLKTPLSKPNPRYRHAMAYIHGTDKVLLFGGRDSSTTYNDTWVYDLKSNTWTQKKPMNKPSARYRHGMAPINGDDKVVLFGGYLSGTGYLGDTWVYDLSDNNWTEKKITPSPSNRYGHGMASVYNEDIVVLFGGLASGSVRCNDTWIHKHFLQMRNGTYISEPYDTGSNSSFNKISWNADIPNNTSIKFQLRTATNESNLNSKALIGMDGTISTYYISSSVDIWPGHTGDRWIQYKAYFNMTTFTGSPSLKDISISYNCLPRTMVVGPINGSLLSNNKPTFTWTFVDHDSEQQNAFQVVIDDDINFENVDYNSNEQNTKEERWEFPTGTDYSELPDGTWYWKIRTRDPDGVWTEYSTPWLITIDTHAPSSATAYPINDGYYNNLTEISGIANDVAPGSGINKIEISIKRLNNNHYWNGSAWITFDTWLIASGTNNWTYDSSLVEWTSGMKYRIQSRATDSVTNIEIPAIENIFTIDKENPKSEINKPVENVWLNDLNTISGSARDYGGSGVNKMEISIMCAKDFISWDDGAKENQFWSGEEWVKEKTWLTASGTTQWNYNVSGIKFTTGDHYTIQSRAIDKTDNVEKLLSEITFMYDGKPPEELAIYINKNDEYTNSNSVLLSLQADDPCSGLNQMAFSTDSAVWSDWEPFNINRTFELSAGDGKKTIYFKVKDFTGNSADPVSDTIFLDTIPPEDLSIEIEDNLEYTTVKRLKLDLKATDKLSGVSEFSYSYNGLDWAPWEPFTQVRYLKLPDLITDGEVTIHYKAKDKVGNIAEPLSDSIILDTLPPYSLSILINKGEVETNSTTVILDLYAVDNTSGVAQISFSTDGETWSNWEEFDESTLFLLPTGNGVKTIFFKVKDKAGNIAGSVADSIMLNITTQTPTIETQASEDSDIWIILVITIIAIIILISVGLIVIIKQKKRVKKELLPAGTLTIKPGGLTTPVISIGKIPATLTPPQLSATGVASSPQSLAKPTHAHVPMLMKSTQIAHESDSQSPPYSPGAQAYIAPDLPQLPPAQIQPTQPEVVGTAPIEIAATQPITPKPTIESPSQSITPQVSTPQAQAQVPQQVVTTPTVTQTSSSSSGLEIHLPDSTSETTTNISKPTLSTDKTKSTSQIPTVTTPNSAQTQAQQLSSLKVPIKLDDTQTQEPPKKVSKPEDKMVKPSEEVNQ